MRLVSIETRQSPFIRFYRESALAQGYDLVLTPPSSSPSPAYKAFAAVYQHHSDNPYDFELNCFRRFFEAIQYVEPRSTIVISDTDQLILSPPKALPEIFFASDAVVGSRGTTNGITEFDISPHFSKWSAKNLRHFIEFLIQTYTDRPDVLAKEYAKRRTTGGRAAVSDMTLFNMFVCEENIQFYDSNSLRFERYVDHNFSMSDAGDGSFRTQFGFKSVTTDNEGGIELIAKSGRPIRPATIHLQGRAKIAAKDMFQKRLNAARAKFFFIFLARALRKRLSD